MNVLITGAGGFIGTAVTQQMLALPDTRVRILLMESEKGLAGLFPQAEAVTGSLQEPAALKQAVSGIDTVIHLASKTIDFDGSGFQTVNVEGTRLLCLAAAEAGARSVIYLSSTGVYGHGTHRNADETTPVRPDTDFSRSKAAAEQTVLDFHERGVFRAAVLRHRFVYGRGDRHVISRMKHAAASYPFLIGGGKARISFILVNELAAVISAFSGSMPPLGTDPVFHVTDGYPVRYRDLIRIFCDTYGYAFPRFSVPFPLLYWPVRLKELIFRIDPEITKSSVSSLRLKLVGLDNFYSNEKLRSYFPGLSLTPFAEAFPELADYYRDL